MKIECLSVILFLSLLTVPVVAQDKSGEIPTTGRGTAASVPSLKPVFFLDFDEHKAGERLTAVSMGADCPAYNHEMLQIDEDGGLLDSKCINAANGAAPAFKAPSLLDALDGSKSITISMWVKYKPDYQKVLRPNHYISLVNALSFVRHNTYRGRNGIFCRNSTDNKFMQGWSGWVSGLVTDDKWMFMAVTYDSTQKDEQLRFYVGTENGEAFLDSTAKLNAGAMVRPRELVVGAATSEGKAAWIGRIDNVRIYSSKTGRSGALTLAQLEEVRQQDLAEGPAPVSIKNAAQHQTDGHIQRYRKSGRSLIAYDVDFMDKVYPDREPPRHEGEYHLPKGGYAPITLALYSTTGEEVSVSLKACKNEKGEAFEGETRIYHALSVPVEANSNGGMRTAVGKSPPPTWMEYLCREAPFEVAEVLRETREIMLPKERFQAVVVDIQAAKSVGAGTYDGVVELTSTSEVVRVPISFTVHEVTFSGTYRLHHNLWLLNNPKWMSTKKLKNELWTEEYLECYLETAKMLKRFSVDGTLLPHINGENPLIKVIHEADGRYSFDYRLFDRVVKSMIDIGYTNLQLMQMSFLTRNGLRRNHYKHNYSVFRFDRKTGAKSLFLPDITRDKSKTEEALDFLAIYYKDLQSHLLENEWLTKVKIGVIDECHDVEQYRRYRRMLSASAPLLETMDANSSYEKFNDLIDNYVFGAAAADQYALLPAAKRPPIKNIWLYHCASPYPPAPNRSLDDPHYGSRVYPWLAHLYGAKGYLIWNANIYRGADPYRSSIGPLPNGRTNPGHPPGDNWLCYPEEKGLAPSLRMLVFREGMIDHTLLSMVGDISKKKSDDIRAEVVRSLMDHSRDNATYHQARTKLLQFLAQQE